MISDRESLRLPDIKGKFKPLNAFSKTESVTNCDSLNLPHINSTFKSPNKIYAISSAQKIKNSYIKSSKKIEMSPYVNSQKMANLRTSIKKSA